MRAQLVREARALGCLSVALGAPPLVSPRRIAGLAGVDAAPHNLTFLRAVGLRELVIAAGLVSKPSPAWVWARVGQDAMDLPLTIRAAIGKRRDQRTRAQVMLSVLMGITAVDVAVAIRASRPAGQTAPPSATITINRQPDEVRARWGDLRVEFGSLTIDENSVRFSSAPGDRGTEVSVSLDPHGSGVRRGAKSRAATARSQQELRAGLRRVKQVLETGEVIRSDGAPRGNHSRSFPQHPAQPWSPAEIAKEA